MGNISNLATVGNYTFETGSLKVTFTFTIDHATRKLQRISQGQVHEGTLENRRELATFNTENYADTQRLTSNIEVGREVEVMTAIVEARAQLESNIATNQVVAE